MDFLLTAQRDLAAARRFLERAIGQHGLPDKIAIDNSGANTAAVQTIQDDTSAPIARRQGTYLNHIVEQDHRAIKRIIRPMRGLQSFRGARLLPAAIETLHMIKQGPLECLDGQVACAAESIVLLPNIIFPQDNLPALFSPFG